MGTFFNPTRVEDPYMFKGIPGWVEVSVIGYQDGDPRFQVSDELGQNRNVGISLAGMREIFAGNEGEMVDPLVGQTHRISLTPWVAEDPNKTFIRIAFQFHPI